MSIDTEVLHREVTKANPAGLVIGDKIKVYAKVSFRYDSKGTKTMYPCTYGFPKWCTVVGVTRKATGKYIGGSGASFGFDGQTASLQVKNWIRVYQCKSDVSDAQPFLVYPDHIIEISRCTYVN